MRTPQSVRQTTSYKAPAGKRCKSKLYHTWPYIPWIIAYVLKPAGRGGTSHRLPAGRYHHPTMFWTEDPVPGSLCNQMYRDRDSSGRLPRGSCIWHIMRSGRTSNCPTHSLFALTAHRDADMGKQREALQVPPPATTLRTHGSCGSIEFGGRADDLRFSVAWLDMGPHISARDTSGQLLPTPNEPSP